MGERGASSAVAARKRGNESFDATPEINRQAQDRAELDDDGIHLPVTVGQADVQEQFGDAQVRRRANREELGETFDNAKDERQQVVVKSSSAANSGNSIADKDSVMDCAGTWAYLSFISASLFGHLDALCQTPQSLFSMRWKTASSAHLVPGIFL